MPDLLTPQTLASAGPLVLDTFFKHFFSHKSLTARSKARGDDLLYDEAFVLMKTFLESATKYPVSSLQKFGQVRTPAPPAVALHHITIPHRSLSLAADYLVKAFGGEEMAFKIAGGSKWWQVRAGNGVEAEWIVMKKDYKEWEREERRAKRRETGKGKEKEKQERRAGTETGTTTPRRMWMGGNSTSGAASSSQAGNGKSLETPGASSSPGAGASRSSTPGSNYHTGKSKPAEIETAEGEEGCWRHEMDEMRCMLYKAPQYPFPCAIQDCLAAYLYLTRPPPGAKHRPVKPEHIVIAGDSAGGGLVLALLQILRDTEGLELPAGAVLISPWSDLTHSFPSILHNTSTDIVPPYSFIHKPSSLWPPPPPDLTNIVQSRLKTKIKEFTHHLRFNPDKAIHNDETPEEAKLNTPLQGQPMQLSEKLRSSQLGNKRKFRFGSQTKADLHPTTSGGDAQSHPDPQGEPRSNPSRANPAEAFARLQPRGENDHRNGTASNESNIPDQAEDENNTLAKCNFPLELTVQDEEVVIDTQIQLYATNAQLCYPLVSPVLGYLGGLCPLYVCCGDNEVLRDEIIFLAHKAANPGKYPLRDDIKKMMPHYEGIEDRYGPTKVHLQVFDGTCHDLPLFSMCKSARGVFRAIATFARHVTPSASVMPTPTTSISKGDTSIFMSPFSGLSRRNTGSGIKSRRGSGTPKSGSSSPTKRTVDLAPVLSDSTLSSSSHPDTNLFDTPLQSSTGLTQNEGVSNISARLNSLSIDPPQHIQPTASPLPMSPVDDMRSRPSAIRTISDMSVLSASSTASSIREEGQDIRHEHNELPPRGAPSGDDAGPRWSNEDVIANPAQPGEAGHPGVYRGADAFKDNMIRERVNPHGKLRPLEPIDQLGAMTMPSSEIGTIKEGPAMRYLTGQYLWDKRYKHARKQVERHRERNLKEARNKDGRRIVESVKGRYEDYKAKREAGGEGGGESGKVHVGDIDVDGLDGGDGEDGREEDWSWGWAWALEGEVPPPSAIVSRRDTSEARKLALIADRLDSARPTAIGGLSIWVALATFFSTTSEKESASKAVHEARTSLQEERRGASGMAGSSRGVTSAEASEWESGGSDDDDDDLDAQEVVHRDSATVEISGGRVTDREKNGLDNHGQAVEVEKSKRRESAFGRIGTALGFQ